MFILRGGGDRGSCPLLEAANRRRGHKHHHREASLLKSGKHKTCHSPTTFTGYVTTVFTTKLYCHYQLLG